MPTYRVWERAVYKSEDIHADNMYRAVRAFAGVNCLKLSGDPALSTKSNTVRFIAEDGSAREFTCYEVHEYDSQ
jgi:hypothetical protein